MTLWLDRVRAGRPVLIAGPTASGKSALAMQVARRIADDGGDAAIVNADSMQVYRELRILTARPSPEDEAAVPHRLFGTVPAAERHSLGRWLADMEAVLAELDGARTTPIVVGGTGLYFRALTEGIAPVPPVPAALRAHWAGELAKVGPAGLHRILSERDPRSAELLRPSDPQRLLRALEVLQATGRPLHEWQQDAGPPLIAPSRAERVVLEVERSELIRRIDARFDHMLTVGALEEVRRLQVLDLPPSLPAMKAIGVRELGAAIRGEISLEEAAERARIETRRYAKRQVTWFRHQMRDWPRLGGDGLVRAS